MVDRNIDRDQWSRLTDNRLAAALQVIYPPILLDDPWLPQGATLHHICRTLSASRDPSGIPQPHPWSFEVGPKLSLLRLGFD